MNALRTTRFCRSRAILRPPNRRPRLGTAGAPLLLLAACNVGPGAEGSFCGSANPSASSSPTAGDDGTTGAVAELPWRCVFAVEHGRGLDEG